MFDTVRKNLEARGFSVRTFATAAEAAAYLNEAIDGKTVGFGGSVTLQDMGLYELLGSHNEVHWHWVNGPEERKIAMQTQVYLTSANGLAETGEIINIDGSCNRVAGTLFGHEKVYFIVGRNKLAPTYDQALWRARNIAAPKNAQRLKCPDRICRSLVVLWGPPIGMETEVVLVDEDLGF